MTDPRSVVTHRRFGLALRIRSLPASRTALLLPRAHNQEKICRPFGKGFILKSNGKEFIARRVASASQAAGFAISRPKHGTIDLLYSLVRVAHLHVRLGLNQTVNNVVREQFAAAFSKRLAEALATAKPIS